jgi:hypothetical protein
LVGRCRQPDMPITTEWVVLRSHIISFCIWIKADSECPAARFAQESRAAPCQRVHQGTVSLGQVVPASCWLFHLGILPLRQPPSWCLSVMTVSVDSEGADVIVPNSYHDASSLVWSLRSHSMDFVPISFTLAASGGMGSRAVPETALSGTHTERGWIWSLRIDR